MTAHSEASVLVIGNFLSGHTGVRCVCEDLAERLSGCGWKVLTASARATRLSRAVDMVRTAWISRHDYRIAQVEVYSGKAFLWAEAVCFTLRLARKPYVLTLHGGSLPAFASRNARRIRRLLSSARIVTAPSNYLVEQMRPYCETVRLVPNALDLRKYQFRQRHTVTPRLVWLRAFHEIYAPDLAVRTLAFVRAAVPGATLLMIGPDKGDGSLGKTRAEACRLGVERHVQFQGCVPKPEVGEWLQHGDIFLNTTTIDNTPISVLEAMACGLCVVSTDAGGIPYMLHHEQDALLVPIGDAAAMASAVLRLISEPRLAATISGNARRNAEASDWPAVLTQWRSLLA
jgi:glycosyltransferase involved in cell wall biosynthesis